MKSYLRLIGLCAITFLVGLIAVEVWRHRLQIYSRIRPIPVTVCDLNREPMRYDGVIIRIRAKLMTADTQLSVYDWDCGVQENWPIVDVREAHDIPLQLKQWINSIQTGDSLARSKEAAVTITGRFDGRYREDRTGSDILHGVHNLKIIPYTIEQRMPIETRHQ